MKPALTCFYVLLLMFSIKTFMRNSDWRDTESISLSALYVNPDNAKVYFSMGNVLAQQVKSLITISVTLTLFKVVIVINSNAP